MFVRSAVTQAKREYFLPEVPWLERHFSAHGQECKRVCGREVDGTGVVLNAVAVSVHCRDADRGIFVHLQLCWSGDFKMVHEAELRSDLTVEIPTKHIRGKVVAILCSIELPVPCSCRLWTANSSSQRTGVHRCFSVDECAAEQIYRSQENGSFLSGGEGKILYSPF